MLDYISITNNIPVKYKTQIVVLGGGTAGVSASISAAKAGASVMLIDKFGFLGGQATGGLVIILCGLKDKKERIVKGFCKETIEYLEHHNAIKPWLDYLIFEPEYLKRFFDEIIIKNNVKLLLNSLVVDVVKDNNHIEFVIIESKSGRCAIKTDYVIDCTGDADTLKWCQEDYEQQLKENARAVTACFRLGGVNIQSAKAFISENQTEYTDIFKKNDLIINPHDWVSVSNDNIAWFDMSHIFNIDITDVEDLTKAELETRKLSWKLFDIFKREVKGFENSYIIDIAPLLGVRDSRRLKGKYFITKLDYNKSFEDTICFAPYYFATDGIGRLEIPYRALLPQKIDNLIVAGRSISVEHNLIDCIREIPACMATGQAAGIASALALKTNCFPDSINVYELRNLLLAEGAYI